MLIEIQNKKYPFPTTKNTVFQFSKLKVSNLFFLTKKFSLLFCYETRFIYIFRFLWPCVLLTSILTNSFKFFEKRFLSGEGRTRTPYRIFGAIDFTFRCKDATWNMHKDLFSFLAKHGHKILLSVSHFQRGN